jgi:hypothetical protein
MLHLIKRLKAMNKEEEFQKKVLRVIKTIYYNDEIKTLDKEMERIESHKGRLNHIIDYAQKKGYLKRIFIGEKGGSIIQIEDKGVDFLINSKREIKQNMINKTIALTGAVIALSTIYSFFDKLNLIKPRDVTTIIASFFMLGCLFFIIFFLIKSFLGEI